jgi:hypothetical protein
MTCRAKTKSGDACRAAAGEGGLCFLHAHPEKARTLGQRGGMRNRRSSTVDIEVPENMTYTDLSRLNAHAIKLLLTGSLHAREAAAFAQLCNAQLRLIQGAELETRLTTLESQVHECVRTSREPVITQADLEVGTDDPTVSAGDDSDLAVIEALESESGELTASECVDGTEVNSDTASGDQEAEEPED